MWPTILTYHIHTQDLGLWMSFYLFNCVTCGSPAFLSSLAVSPYKPSTSPSQSLSTSFSFCPGSFSCRRSHDSPLFPLHQRSSGFSLQQSLRTPVISAPLYHSVCFRYCLFYVFPFLWCLLPALGYSPLWRTGFRLVFLWYSQHWHFSWNISNA